MNKNWGDKADKDLFFTLLSVKNVGVITGPEWATVGNAMRMMGYGFTNEGCRQHFQGLRRTQYKDATAANLLPDGRFKHDPSQNPVTRRPGPGRGRPRKNAAVKRGTIPIEPLPEGVRIVSVGPRYLRPAPPPGDVTHSQALVQTEPHNHVISRYSPPPSSHGVPVHHGLPPPTPSAQLPSPANQSPPALTRPPLAPVTENNDAPGEDEPPSKRPRVDGRETNGTIVDLALAASSQLEEESADDMEDDDEEEEELFGGLEAPESSVAVTAEKDDIASNHDTEAAVLTLVTAGDGPPTAASNVSSPSWGTSSEAEPSAHPI